MAKKKSGNIVDSVGIASAQTGIPTDEIKWCKLWKNPPAPDGTFPGGSRVNLDLLVPYHAAHKHLITASEIKTMEQAELRYKIGRARKIEREVSILERESIPVQEVDEQATFAGNLITAKVMSLFVTELPARTAGMDETGIREKNREAAVAFLTDLHSRITWYREPEKKDT